MPYFDQKDGNYDLLKEYCDKRGIKMNFILNQLIDQELARLKRK